MVLTACWSFLRRRAGNFLESHGSVSPWFILPRWPLAGQARPTVRCGLSAPCPASSLCPAGRAPPAPDKEGAQSSMVTWGTCILWEDERVSLACWKLRQMLVCTEA